MNSKNDNGRRIKNCWDCSHHYATYYEFGCTYGLRDSYRDVPLSAKEIPSWCRLPDWKRTLEVKLD